MKLEIRKGFGLLLGAAGLALAYLAWTLGSAAELPTKLLAVCCAVFALCGWIRIRTKFRPLQWLTELGWAAVGMPFCFFVTQHVMDSEPIKMVKSGKVNRLGITICICTVVVMVLYTILGSVRWSVIIAHISLTLLATANSFIYLFRGNELIPADFTSFGTAMNVAASYDFDITPEMYRGWILLLAFLWASLLLPRWIRPVVEVPAKKKGGKPRKKRMYTKFDVSFAVGTRLVTAVLAAVIAVGTMNYGLDHIVVKHFKRQGTDANGFLVNFYLRIPEMIPTKPDSYSIGKVNELEERIQGEMDAAGTVSTETKPTVIAIMDESFADISVRNPDGILNTNQVLFPYFDTLSEQENTISGYALASVFGGNTPNSEYEFLTGHSQAWNPLGTISYQNDVRDGDYSLVKVLHDQGYNCTAMHPFTASGWKRPTVYPAFGFDTALFKDDFNKKNIFRHFISDEEMFNKIITLFENKDDTPQFYYGVTIQNHGKYKYEGFEHTVKQVGYDKGSKQVDQYLTLIHETDRAVEQFINYFSEVEEPVVIVFFGDHQAHIPEKFYDELHGGPLETMDEKQLQYTVPFFIWANYDIEEEYVERTSLNYLSVMTMKAAGLPLSPYQQFLSDLQEEIPAINQLGYYSIADQCYKEFKDAEGDEAEALEEYAVLQYNDLHDRKRSSGFFFPDSRE